MFDISDKPACCTNVALGGKSCSRMLTARSEVVQNFKSCCRAKFAKAYISGNEILKLFISLLNGKY